MGFRILNGLACVAFLSSAMLQLNDPDPIPWVALYASAAGLCFLPRIRPAGYGFLGLIAVGWSVHIARTGEWGTPMAGGGGLFAEEIVREIGGLWLVAGWMAVLAYRRHYEAD